MVAFYLISPSVSTPPSVQPQGLTDSGEEASWLLAAGGEGGEGLCLSICFAYSSLVVECTSVLAVADPQEERIRAHC